MDTTQKIEITVGLVVATAVSGLLMPAWHVANLTNVEWGNEGCGLAAKFQDIDGVLQRVRSNNGRRVEAPLDPGSTQWRTGMKAKHDHTAKYPDSPARKVYKRALHDLQIGLLRGAGI